MGLLGLIIVGLLLYWLLKKPAKPQSESAELQLIRRNTEWVEFIKGYRKVATTKAERAMVEKMLADIQGQGLANTQELVSYSAMVKQSEQVANLGGAQERPAVIPTYTAASVAVEPSKPAIELDNTTLLLYFGAFLFVASVGLFITFGGANGILRTVAVLLVMASLYGSGVWIFRTKPKLEQAGLAFAGIGMTIAPLAGVAAYYYLFGQTNGAFVWFMTSLVCLGMYAHALVVLRKPLINYILIFTFLSLFESGVSILAVPIYYFGWAMAFVGILLVLFSRLSGKMADLQESSRNSSQLFLPIALCISLVLLPQQGAGQLGISLLFAAFFYGLEALSSKDMEQQNNALVSHVTLLIGICCISFSLTDSWSVVALTILLLNVVQVLCVALAPAANILWRNFASVLLATSVIGAGFGFVSSPGLLLAALACLALVGMVVWLCQKRSDSYVLGMVGLMALPLAYGQAFATYTSSTNQAILMFGALIVQLVIYGAARMSTKLNDKTWAIIAQQTYIVSLVAVLVAALFASVWACLGLSLAAIATAFILSEAENDGDWGIVAGLAIAVPLLRSLDDSGALVATNVIAVLLNIYLALRHRKEANRWFGSIVWFALPLSLGTGYFGHWSVAGYAWAYLVIMFGLILARMIARGVVFISGKVPLQSYAKTASLSYVVGYSLAGVVAIILSIASDNSQLHTSVIVAICMFVTYLLSKYVEKRADLWVLQPIAAQLLLWSIVRPVAGATSVQLFLVASSVLAAALYVLSGQNTGKLKTGRDYLRATALITAYITPAAALFTTTTILMPIGLLAAGLLTYYHNERSSQSNKEFSLVVVVAAIEWLLYYAGVREFQAYTHVVVATLGIFAYWRAVRGEVEVSDQYLLCMLATATIPLTFQALGGQAGGLYGWWLLLEQIGFMLLGMAIHKRLVTRWGLYVSVAAVLYQLRNLGWAALTVLAIFLIGIAIYNLQKPGDKN